MIFVSDNDSDEIYTFIFNNKSIWNMIRTLLIYYANVKIGLLQNLINIWSNCLREIRKK